MDFSGSGTCTCGKKMTGRGGHFAPLLSTTFRECECGISAVFFTLDKDYEFIFQAIHINHNENLLKNKEKLLSIFTLADLHVLSSWNIQNEYTLGDADWLLVKTELGMIKIGWRKRVINIDWSDTGIRYVIESDTTKWDYGCHAWSYEDAIKFLKELKKKVAARYG